MKIQATKVNDHGWLVQSCICRGGPNGNLVVPKIYSGGGIIIIIIICIISCAECVRVVDDSAFALYSTFILLLALRDCKMFKGEESGV